MTQEKTVIALGILGLMSAGTLGGIHLNDFWVTDSVGRLYEVDGNSLQATAAHQIQSEGFVNEIEYFGGSMIMANMSNNSLVMIDVATGQEQTLVERNRFPAGSFRLTEGLVRTGHSSVYFSTHIISEHSHEASSLGYEYNIATDRIELLHSYDAVQGGAFDHHLIGQSRLITADYQGQRAWVRDRDDGDLIRLIELDYDIVSFMEHDGNLITVTAQGDLYQLFTNTGVSNYLGSISGTGTNLIGATIPSPGGISMLGVSVLFGVRRRR